MVASKRPGRKWMDSAGKSKWIMLFPFEELMLSRGRRIFSLLTTFGFLERLGNFKDWGTTTGSLEIPIGVSPDPDIFLLVWVEKNEWPFFSKPKKSLWLFKIFIGISMVGFQSL